MVFEGKPMKSNFYCGQSTFKSLFVHFGTQHCGIANDCLQATCLQCVASFSLSHEYS